MPGEASNKVDGNHVCFAKHGKDLKAVPVMCLFDMTRAVLPLLSYPGTNGFFRQMKC